MTLSAMAVMVSLPPAASGRLRVLLAELLELGDVGLVALRDVRDRGPCRRQPLRRFPADVAHRLHFDLAPLAEVGQRRQPRTRPPPPSVIHRAVEFTSSTEMRPPGPVPSTAVMSTPSSRA